tara:strand:- start:3249 stop:3488 length:240 start_codon:yes stop_codon:yes gene_type:complete
MTHTLTELEIACGVTLEGVAYELPRGLFIDNDTAFIVSGQAGPALAGSVARCAFGVPATYAGMNSHGDAVYRLTDTKES